jgi:hypothetical protein
LICPFSDHLISSEIFLVGRVKKNNAQKKHSDNYSDKQFEGMKKESAELLLKVCEFSEINSSIHIPMVKVFRVESQLLNPATLISCFLALQELGKIDHESTK